MLKKKMAFMLAALMMASAVTACGTDTKEGGSSTADSGSSSTTNTEGMSRDELAFMKFDKPVDVHIGMSVSPTDKTLPEGDSAEDNQYTRYLEENYNINVVVDWTAAEGNDFNQKASLAIAGDSLPDGLVVNDQTYKTKAAKSGMLKDITDIFEKYASSQVMEIMESTDGEAMKAASYDGKMVSLPNISVNSDGVHVMHIRKDWLDECGLEPPKTVDDIENIAKVFMEKKPAGDNTIAISGPDKTTFSYATFLTSSNCQYGFDPIFQAYDAYPGYWIEGEDGKVVWGTTTQETRDALERLASWYKQGLIDPEMGVRDRAIEPINAGYVGMFSGPWWSLGYGNGDAFKNDPTANWQSYPILTDDGKWNVHTKAVGTQYTLIDKDTSDEVAAAIMIMNNALVRDEAVFDVSVAIGWYPLRNVMSPADEIEYEYDELLKVLNGETTPEDYNTPLNPYKLIYSDAQKVKTVVPGFENGRDLNVEDFNQENSGDFQRMYAMLIGGRPYATTPVDKEVRSVTYAQTETMEKRWANLKKLEDEMILKVITGKADISAFDSFVEQWKAEGGDEITKEVQAIADEE